MTDTPAYNILLYKLALKYRKPVSVIKQIVESQFEFIYETTKQMDFSKIQSEEEFKELKTNFNVKYLFTLYSRYKIVENINKNRNKKYETENSNTEKC